MRSLFRSLRAVGPLCLQAAILAIVLFMPVAGLTRPAPVDELLRNDARTTYFNVGLGMRESLVSNLPEAVVRPFPEIDVEGYTDLVLTRGAIDLYHYAVNNTGNVPLEVSWSMRGAGDMHLMQDARLIHDINGNGNPDAYEPVITASDVFTLAPDEELDLIYAFRVSEMAAVGESFSASLVAEAKVVNRPSIQTITAVATDEAIGKTMIVAGGLEIQKRQSVQPGENATFLTYELTLRNNSEQAIAGYSEIDGIALRIDGSPATGVLMSDEVPLNTRFVRFENSGGLLALYHRRGDGAQSYVTNPPALSEIDAIAFFHEGDYVVGRSSDTGFVVQIDHGLGEAEITNRAATHIGTGTGYMRLPSNVVKHRTMQAAAGTLDFFDPVSRGVVRHGQLDSDLQVRVALGACNATSAIDVIDVTLRSSVTGDKEVVTARETGANTGVFEIAPMPVTRMAIVAANDGVLASDQGDQVYAFARCDNRSVENSLYIEPGNFIFNAISNDPVEGVEITLTEIATGRDVARATSDARGYFSFASMPAGTYQYGVQQSGAWSYPTARSDFSGYGRTLSSAAFGASFQHGGGRMAGSDIPVDPAYPVAISLSKVAERDVVAQGDFLSYTLTLTNSMYQSLTQAELVDRPSYGAEFVAGSATLDGMTLSDPVKDSDGDLIFDLGDLAPLGSVEMTYLVHFSAGAREGRNENTALLHGRQAGTGTYRQSPLARAVVRLDNSGGVFSRQGTIIGSVFMDCNGNGIRDGWGEPGIPGVRIVTQEGLFVVTDLHGRYSLPGMRPVTHAFQVQKETLPVGTTVSVTRTNDLGRGGSRIVPLKRGELRAEHFAVSSCSPAALAEVTARQEKFEVETAGRNPVVSGDGASGQVGGTVGSARSAAGIATTTQLTTAMVAQTPDDPAARRAPLTQKSAAKSRRRPLASLVKSVDSEAAFLDLLDGDTLASRTQNIRVKGKGDLTFTLLVNNRALDVGRVGERSTWAKRNVQALEFVAVKLRPGANTLTLIGADGFGIERVRQSISVTAPGDPARIEIIAPQTATANPVSVLPVVVRILDAGGLPVPASAIVTLHGGRALWDVSDIRPGTPGVQAYIDNGEATFGLSPPQVSGPVTLRVEASFAKSEVRVTFTPDLDERIMIGVIEGAVALKGGAGGPLLGAKEFSHFEETTTGLRGELYLKGAIRGDALLTLRYSSDRDTEDRLFRDINGEEYYPVYGDSSERGHDAQSSTNLFVKVEKGRSYVLYGDIAIEPEASTLKLGGQNRVTTGAKAHWENDRAAITVFAAHTAQTQEVVEFPGRGVSGPYDMTLGGYVDRSERVEVLVRDRDGGDVLTSTPMRRGTDYLLVYFRNTITFSSPVNQFDGSGNPVSVRVTYEVTGANADRYWLYGGEARYALTDRTTIGARVVQADAPLGNAARYGVQSGYIRHDTGTGGVWEAEAARSVDENGTSDLAGRLSYDVRHEGESISFEAIHTGQNFVVGGGLARAGTTQLRLRYGVEVSRKDAVSVAAEYVRDRKADSRILTLDALYARQFSDQLRGEVGVEYKRGRVAGAALSHSAAILGAHWVPKTRPNNKITGQLRFPLHGEGGDPANLVIGAYSSPKPGWTAYTEAEFKLQDGFALTRARRGFDHKMADWLTGTLEFTQAPGESEATFTQGVTAAWDLNALTNLRLNLEHSRKADTGRDALTSIAVGTKWQSSDARIVGDADLETTMEPSGDTYYASLGLAGQITPDLSLLGRSRVARDDRSGQNALRSRTRIGAAYRPVEDPRIEMLAWYEHQLERKGQKVQKHLWSVDTSYEADENFRVNGKYAGQYQSISIPGAVSASAMTQLVQGGLDLEFGDDRYRLGLNAAHLWDNRGGRSTGLGLELGVVATEGVLMAAGYNATKGEVSGQSSLYQSGFYLRFSLLLDNSLLSQLDGVFTN